MSEITWSLVIATRNRFGLLRRAISAVAQTLSGETLCELRAPFSPTGTWGSRDLLFFQGQVLPRDYWSHLTLAKACWSLVSSFCRRGSQCSIDLRLFFQFVLIRLKWR